MSWTKTKKIDGRKWELLRPHVNKFTAKTDADKLRRMGDIRARVINDPKNRRAPFAVYFLSSRQRRLQRR